MKPEKDEDAIVDVLDVVLRDGAVVRADVIVSVAEIPLVGIKLTAVIAGMETMTEYGLFEEWDTDRRAAAVARRQYGSRNDKRETSQDRADTIER
ncbi:gas vesicle protein GvpM [Natrialbaceae archaeon AArc-T1-2]|uniref:gas vesicle protein GvpM n=1 Tax=Natrialbaceae archaeon AArc-T1-2 TaxID=3053904 RepID=UPI00255B1A35|nr:gas vesicle protein [Natrialbaceae archaeon AArc-T1-2]WIV67584.1 gas vesicle protein [Natrialbaceae archaeon AArc-T1-2]